MAISGNLTINIGLPNESTGSDSLYTAFTKINTNFNTLFSNASRVIAGNGITVTNNPSNTVVSTNLIAGNGISLTNSNGAITITNTGAGNGGGGGTITSVTAGAGLTGGGNTGGVTLALGNSNVTAGIYTNPTVTVDSFGRITSASNNTVSGTVTSVAVSPGAGIAVAGGPITSNGVITVTNTGVLRLTAGTGITLTGNTGNILVSATTTGVTSVGITSNNLTVTSSPIVSAGNISVNIPNTIALSGNITSNNLIANTLVKTSALAFASLPLANAAGAGTRAFISDGNLAASTNFGAQVTGGGSNNVPVYSDGTNWRIG
jgi:hypothetical protein